MCESGRIEHVDDWIYSGKLRADELKKLKIQEKKTSTSRSKTLTISKHLNNNSDWSRKANKYLSLKSKDRTTRFNINVAAKLAVSHSSAEEQLITAIELAREGYLICSLAAVSQIIKREELTRDDRLDACVTALEEIITKKASTIELDEELIYNSRFYQKIIKALNTILELYQNREEPEKLSQAIENAMEFETKDVTPKTIITEKISLDISKKRNLTIQEVSQKYEKPVIRSIHHFACTGGTLISKCLASMPNVAVISEVNPMNRSASKFTPSNPLILLERNFRDFTTEEKIDIFKEEIQRAMKLCYKDDIDLILRDHSHTDFCKGSKVSETYAIRDHLREDYHLISVVTVRHPLDSYLSLLINGWEHFEPRGINEYSKRYLKFIDKYSSSEIIRYEDFCENSPEILKKLCNILKIGYDRDFMNTFGEKNLSGDSGRSEVKSIKARERREVPEEITKQLENSEYYQELIERLNY